MDRPGAQQLQWSGEFPAGFLSVPDRGFWSQVRTPNRRCEKGSTAQKLRVLTALFRLTEQGCIVYCECPSRRTRRKLAVLQAFGTQIVDETYI